MASRVVLLIDDDQSVRRGIARFLKATGNTVIEAGNAEEGLRLFAERRADIAAVITDKEMGSDMEAGFKVVSAVRGENPKLPIAMISATFEDEAALERILANLGGAEFMAKMGSGMPITERLESWLDREDPRQQERQR